MFKHLKVTLVCIAITSVSASLLNAQITIGSTAEPGKGALLELKEQNAAGASPTSNKGFVFPRVELTDRDNLYPMFESDLSGNYKIGSVGYSKTAEDAKHAGMIVYNVKTAGDFAPGLHIWNGSTWLRLDNSPVIAPSITDLLCNGWTMQPATYTASTYFEGVLKVPYTGGNGGAYDGTSSIALGSTGLFIERIAGKLAIGGGEVMFRVHGTPNISSPTATPVNISFLGKNCSSLQLGSSTETKAMLYAKKTVPLVKTSPSCGSAYTQTDSPTTAASEMSFGKLKIRLRYYHVRTGSAGTCGWLMFPQFSVVDGTANTNAIIYMDKAGTGMGNGAAFSCFAKKVLQPNVWKRMNGGAVGNGNLKSNGDGLDGGTTAFWTVNTYDDITISNRDIVLIYVQLQHDTHNHMYRIAINAYEDIPAGGGALAVAGKASIFIELLE